MASSAVGGLSTESYESSVARPSSLGEESETGPTASADSANSPHRRWSLSARSLAPERVGTEISKRYDVLDVELGFGGNGSVHVARDRLLKGRLVAVKKVVRSNARCDSTTKIIEREVQIMKDLDHPSICKLFETYSKGQHMCFVIEHFEGGDVGKRLMEGGPIPEAAAAAIMCQVSGALLYTHQRGIAHRDMKPENICFCSNSPDDLRVKVIDWGLGKHFKEGRLCSSVGTSNFTAPEVLFASDDSPGYTSACDLWSLGVTVYTMLSCKAPFWGNTLEKLLRRMQEERYPLGGDAWDVVSEEGKDFIRRLLRFRPDARLPAVELLSHSWTVGHRMPRDAESLSEVLRNVERFSHASDIWFFCTVSLARQLDHRNLTKIYRVFSWLDLDGDGRLSLPEFADGFREVFGADSDECAQVEHIFSRLDFEQNGYLSYTTFCAAGMAEDYLTDDDMLLAAFKTFDVLDNGRISPEDMRQASSLGGLQVGASLMERLGRQEGGVSFEEWAQLVRQSARGRQASAEPSAGRGQRRADG